MINQRDYDELKEKFWDVASWTMWEQPTDRPKSNMGSLKVFDDPDLLSKINTGFVFVGLNGSGVHNAYLEFSKPWYNFHSDLPSGNDYKLRYALNGTPFWGSYITDIIKYYQEVDSSKAVKYVKEHPEVMRQNIEAFKDELRLLSGNPVIVALGGASHKLITEYLHGDYRICMIRHYSYTIGKEDYRKEALETLTRYL